jgi:ectoine hydroxylase-related dioxygenase (phytanoyl-CoA dioxygenase family)
MLTAAQREQYERDGFLVLPGYLDKETVAALAHAAEELRESVGPLVKGNPRVQIDRLGEKVGIRQAWPVIDLSPTFAALARDERIVGLFRSLFDGDTPVLFEDKLNYKHPGIGTPFPMHQDYSYWKDYSPRLTSALIYIDEATAENGCLEVIAGQHRRGLLDRTEQDVGAAVDHFIPETVLAPALAVKVPGPPGTLILFSCLTPHTSAPNRSDRPRRALILTYNPARDGSGYEATSGENRDRSNAWLAAQRATAAP